MKYNHRAYHNQCFEASDLKAYRAQAMSEGMDLTQWIQKQCARAVKRDGRTPSNRDRKAARGE